MQRWERCTYTWIQTHFNFTYLPLGYALLLAVRNNTQFQGTTHLLLECKIKHTQCIFPCPEYEISNQLACRLLHLQRHYRQVIKMLNRVPYHGIMRSGEEVSVSTCHYLQATVLVLLAALLRLLDLQFELVEQFVLEVGRSW